MHSRQCWLDKESSLVESIKYCEEAIAHPTVEDWERKEYQSVLDDNRDELIETQTHIAYLKEIGMWNKMVEKVSMAGMIRFEQTHA